MSRAQMSSRAAEAATRLAHHLRIRSVDPVILHESQHISIRLSPLNVVARAVSLADREATKRLIREIGVAHYLVKNGAPIVAPSTEPPGGPHIQEGFMLTLWEFVEHVAADGDNAEHVALAAEALRRVHQAFAGFSGELPDFWVKVDCCRRMIENGTALPALDPTDRAFLRTAFDRLRALVTGLPAKAVPIHGDAHLGNVLITRDGARWNDLEDVCVGPREWDISWLPEAGLSAFAPINRDLLFALRYLRSACVSIWCWEKCDMPEKREAAEHHLGYLKESGLFER